MTGPKLPAGPCITLDCPTHMRRTSLLEPTCCSIVTPAKDIEDAQSGNAEVSGFSCYCQSDTQKATWTLQICLNRAFPSSVS